MKRKKKTRANQRRQIKKSAAEKVRKRMARQMMHQYARMRRQSGGKLNLPTEATEAEDHSPIEDHFSLDDEVEIAHCNGVGECCKDRYIPVDPSDVWRVLRNKRVREKWGVVHTGDLYGTGKPFVYDIDARSGIPGCATVRVPSQDGETQHCPFFDGSGETPECILGDDRLTYCKADPITRTAKVNGKRRLSGWSYAHNGMPCFGCMQADKEKQRRVKVEDWLVENGMEERYLLTDMFHGFVGWLRGTKTTVFHRRLASLLLFNWHSFLLETGSNKGEVPWEEPRTPAGVLVSARAILQGALDSEGALNAGDEAEERPSGTGE